jgi:hypothetical protein
MQTLANIDTAHKQESIATAISIAKLSFLRLHIAVTPIANNNHAIRRLENIAIM